MDVPLSNGTAPTSLGSSAIDDDAHGRAGLLLTESLMHCLVAKGLISRQEFIEIVEIAAEVECMPKATNDIANNVEITSLLCPLAAAFRRELGQ